MASNDSHFPNDKHEYETAPIPQRKRMAMGEKVDGRTNPHGADKGSTEKCIKNQPKVY